MITVETEWLEQLCLLLGGFQVHFEQKVASSPQHLQIQRPTALFDRLGQEQIRQNNLRINLRVIESTHHIYEESLERVRIYGELLFGDVEAVPEIVDFLDQRVGAD